MKEATDGNAPRLALNGDDRIYVPVDHGEPVTHVRLNIFPDGGVARLRECLGNHNSNGIADMTGAVFAAGGADGVHRGR